MVLNRNDKRKRKEGDLVDLMEPLSESPKRTKVHAQRKFAQGATTVFSPSHTPVKDKEKIKPTVMTELITHKRPNTEDFLTYLCFRGTSILPPSLNFFNVGAKKEKQEPKTVRTTVQDKNSSLSSTSVETLKADLTQKTVVKVKAIITDKKKVTNGMQKNMTKFKNATSTIQALKKKYQEQRLAKQRIKNKFKSPCVMRTRSCTERAVLKTGPKLAPRKFLPRIETKRHGLRSSVLSQKAKKPSPKPKHAPPKPKKKIIVKHKSSESSNSDVSSGEEENEEERDEEEDEEDDDDNEELPLEKSTAQVKRNIQKNVQKRICTRSKSEMRRITRSHTGTNSPKNLSRRPTRKTKEAAAVYMEILGRKLVSPDLENDDVSVDSFPELPNARKIAQTENEIKAKVKQTTVKSLGKGNKVCNKVETASNVSNKRTDKSKGSSKVILKSKRLIRVQRYCEIDTDEESVSSVEASTRPNTRRSVGKVNKPAARSLRSSSRNISTTVEVQSSTSSTKQVGQSNQGSVKSSKDKFVVKRKREQNVSKPVPEKAKADNGAKQKETKADENEITESDEETLGMLLNKMKKKKETAIETKPALTVETEIVKEEKVESETVVTKAEFSKVSDDEESFRGFSKKAISKVLNSCQTHASANLLVAEDANGKVSSVKETDHQETTSVACSTTMEIIEEKPSPIDTAPVKKSTEEEFAESQVATVETPTITEQQDVTLKVDKKCSHETEVPSSSVVDMSLSNLHVRKERVNMSAEQIEKWLNESSLAKEESKLEMENMSTFRYDTSISEKVVKADVSHLSISTKIQHLVRPVNVTLSKLVEKSARDRRTNIQCKTNLTLIASDAQTTQLKPRTLIPAKNKVAVETKDILPAQNVSKSSKESLHGEDSDTVSKSDHNSIDGSTEKKSPTERKTIFQPRKPFLPKVKERKVTTNANAFSPENESSVYAFESDTELPISTPFRRKVRDSAGSSKLAASAAMPEIEGVTVEEATKCTIEEFQRPLCSSELTKSDAEAQDSKNTAATMLAANKFELPKNFVNLANVQVLPLDKLTTTWSNVNCSASIAVQVNLDHQAQEQGQLEVEDSTPQKCTEISTQTEGNNENDDDNDGQLFYIPLQAVTRNGPNLVQGQQLIQGVAVKLGTEGPNGPNQRVLLRAKLVTKPPLSVARCPPVGTVQPTTRTPPNVTTVYTENPIPTTSFAGALPSATPATSSTITPAVAPPASSVATVTTVVTMPTTATTSTITPPSAIESSSTVTSTTEGTTQTSQSTTLKHPKTSGGTERVNRSPKAARERKTSVDSTKNGKRAPSKSKLKAVEFCSPSNSTMFPNTKSMNNEARLVEAPTFHPTEKDFQDPLEYIDKIRPIAEKFGICRVVPPPNFKPECKVSDDMRFTAYNQYVHRMLHRWGPNVKEMMAIKKYLATQSITLTHPPWIGGMEVDLPHLYQTVQSLGGLKEVIEKKKWQKVADGMKIPKSAQDRVTKLDDIYCKYLLPYDTLSPEERGKLFDEVETEWTRRESRALERQNSSCNDTEDDEDEDSSDEIEECIVKGRNMPLNAFYRIARNTQRMWFGENQRSGNEAEGASADEVEGAFWKHVAERKRHVCVHAASIDSSGRGFGFSVAKNSPFARHPWNLKVLTNNAGSVLRALGPLMGVTIPTLHVGMLFSACCWYRDPHGLPWIEYLHTGAKKIWYGIPDEHNNNFREALSKMVPRYCKNKTIWLPSDTAMVPPELLVSNGVPLCQTVQEPGQFIIVFPKAFTSSICTGYVVSESVYFAQSSWLETGEQVYRDIQDSCEPSIFSFERLLFNIINDTRSHVEVLKQILPTVMRIRDREIEFRQQLESTGLTNTEKLPLPDSGKRRKGKKVKEDDGDFECEICRANLFVSLVNNSQDDSVYCLMHALHYVAKKKQVLKQCTLMYTYSEDELDDLVHKLEDRIEAKSKKSNQIKQTK